ncbi:DUF402 domain-containing protein [Streptantibioticus silvisoli]|uniref:DUF402 domain-containing protein n=1 Tax=Streptantibioticus silvisoli TaxID=2705255 RepID=A0ABT6W1C4_9ACTN|nr:DUF402 domain-containing protein [Streptantibioticus silvisoli]MDI5964195.1 DUF402 domain-containing protein [Streptantibioticus silvisoli]
MSDERSIRVEFTKYDGSLHWHHTARLLGEDVHGVWAGCPAGASMRRGQEPPVVFPQAFVMLFPRDGWWTASFNAAPHKTEVYCDIATVPSWPAPDTVTMVDLDLDVIRKRNGRIYLDDEDEFDEHRVRYAYPPQVVSAARASAERLLKAVRVNAEPFATVSRDWLARVD